MPAWKESSARIHQNYLSSYFLDAETCLCRKEYVRQSVLPIVWKHPFDRRGFAPFSKPRKVDKMTNGREHLSGREVEKPLEATGGRFPDSRASLKALLSYLVYQYCPENASCRQAHTDRVRRILRRILVDPPRKCGSWASKLRPCTQYARNEKELQLICRNPLISLMGRQGLEPRTS